MPTPAPDAIRLRITAAEIAANPLLWLSTARPRILHPTRGYLRLDLPYRYQAAILIDRAPARCILKARQIGVSQIIALEALHTILYRPGATVLIVSRNLEAATNVLRYIKTALATPGLPAPEITKNQETHLALANGASVLSIPAHTARPASNIDQNHPLAPPALPPVLYSHRRNPMDIPLNTLTPHPANYNRHSPEQIARLVESRRRFGQTKEIVVWAPDPASPIRYIIAGHGLVEAARSLGWPTLRAADMTGKTPVRLAPNPTAIPPQSNTSGQPLVEPMQ